MSWIVSLICRSCNKLLVEYLVMVQFRHPLDLGGMYWITCLVLGQATSFVALYLYSSSGLAGAESANRLWALLVSLETAFVAFFAVFVATMKKNRATFFSTVTGKHFVQLTFEAASNDYARATVFDVHPTYYAQFRNDVETWVRENYGAWNEERPDWFTERVKASIPVDMIPVDEVDETRTESAAAGARGAKERRSSVQIAKEAIEEVVKVVQR